MEQTYTSRVIKETKDILPKGFVNSWKDSKQPQKSKFVKELSKNLAGLNTAESHDAREHNSQITFEKTPMPITNTGLYRDNYQVWVIGFNGEAHVASVILDTGCTANGVIGSYLAKRANILSDKHGCSYVFVVNKNGREFFGVAQSDSQSNQKACYVEDRQSMPGFAGIYKEQGIDLLISYKTLEQMTKLGFFPVTNPELFIEGSQKTIIPFSFKSGLKSFVNGTEATAFINTANFCPDDIILSFDFARKHILNDKHDIDLFGVPITRGTVDSFELVYEQTFTFNNVSFVCLDQQIVDSDGNNIDCIVSVGFMTKLAKMGIIPTII
jgi:hypothetical protein